VVDPLLDGRPVRRAQRGGDRADERAHTDQEGAADQPVRQQLLFAGPGVERQQRATPQGGGDPRR
jgi:hypothetical protein